MESVCLLNEEKVSFYISHGLSSTVISEQNVFSIFNTLHCATVATANELSDKNVARSFYRTTPPTRYWGYAVADFLMKWDSRRVAILAEICVVLNLIEEAAKQGYIQNNEMFFIGTPINILNDKEIRFHNFTHIIPYLYGAMTMELGRNDDPPPTTYRKFISSNILAPIAANPPFPVKDMLEQKEDTIVPGCLSTAIPTMSELVNRGMVTWTDIATGTLLTKVPLATFIRVMNELKLPGFGERPFAFDAKTGDPVSAVKYILGTVIYNKTKLEMAQTWTSSSTLYLSEYVGVWYNGSIIMEKDFTFPDGSKSPPRVMPRVLEPVRSTTLFLSMLVVTLILEALYVLTLIAIILKRKSPAVRKNSVIFTSFIVFGCICIQATIIPEYFGGFDTSAGCRSAFFLFHIGFAFTFGACFLKVYRIHRILNNRNGSTKLRDPILLQYYSVI
ncbi:hypothetical protein HK102_001972 [Quaeritorhiza haematococci]|nr:hypothetical protein HK102_001972 [Quaeritorhiza haematococci]